MSRCRVPSLLRALGLPGVLLAAGSNRDRPRKPPLPEHSNLVLYRIGRPEETSETPGVTVAGNGTEYRQAAAQIETPP